MKNQNMLKLLGSYSTKQVEEKVRKSSSDMDVQCELANE